MTKLLVILFLIYSFSSITFADNSINSAESNAPTIKIGVQATGTLAWELAKLQSEKHTAFRIEQRILANAEAGKIALQSGAVDMIVSDWIWAAKMRDEGSDFSFYPYSSTSGVLMAPAKSEIKSINDLKGKRLGIAGGELDKNWLLLKALAQQEKIDLTGIETVFGAPPLINEQLLQGRVDVALNYWHYGAKLEAQGYRAIINGREIIEKLGIKQAVPSLGYVFKQSWAQQHKAAVNAFFTAANNAKQALCSNEKDWQHIVPLLQVDDTKTQNSFRQRYCKGEIKQWGNAERNALDSVYATLKTISNNKLTGQAEHLPSELFWSAD
ncbi:MAG: ABC transporter substrate-binding protein [Gammaproteobacteria bacterium]|nr:ABC transporter substrate-binding protein [Gammaproteobacteria bacterium]